MIKHCSPLGKMAEITEFLYLGGLAAAKMEHVLTTKGITCVINGKLVIIFLFLSEFIRHQIVPFVLRLIFVGCPISGLQIFVLCLLNLSLIRHYTPQ